MPTLVKLKPSHLHFERNLRNSSMASFLGFALCVMQHNFLNPFGFQNSCILPLICLSFRHFFPFYAFTISRVILYFYSHSLFYLGEVSRQNSGSSRFSSTKADALPLCSKWNLHFSDRKSCPMAA